MIIAAEHEFRLGESQDDGEPLRHHLEAVEKRSGKRPRELDGPGMPVEAEHVWAWFNEMNMSRHFNEAGPQAFSELDLWAWQMNTGRHLAHWEAAALRRLDMAFRSFAAKSFKAKMDRDAASRAANRKAR